MVRLPVTFFLREVHLMKRLILLASIIVVLACSSRALFAFCGFYVAKADAMLFNRGSQVVLARDGDRTILTMANDFKGDVFGAPVGGIFR